MARPFTEIPWVFRVLGRPTGRRAAASLIASYKPPLADLAVEVLAGAMAESQWEKGQGLVSDASRLVTGRRTVAAAAARAEVNFSAAAEPLSILGPECREAAGGSGHSLARRRAGGPGDIFRGCLEISDRWRPSQEYRKLAGCRLEGNIVAGNLALELARQGTAANVTLG